MDQCGTREQAQSETKRKDDRLKPWGKGGKPFNGISVDAVTPNLPHVPKGGTEQRQEQEVRRVQPSRVEQMRTEVSDVSPDSRKNSGERQARHQTIGGCNNHSLTCGKARTFH